MTKAEAEAADRARAAEAARVLSRAYARYLDRTPEPQEDDDGSSDDR